MRNNSIKHMFSFIVIGKNEGWKLPLCFSAILNCVKKNRIEDYEILYVDSRSTDNSIAVAKGFPDIKIFCITGRCNAAIARNIGGIEAQGDVLCFLDGDMELQADFVSHIFKENGELVHPFFSGIYCHYYYDNDWQFLHTELPHNTECDAYKKTTGGFFFITKELWTIAGGMDSRLVTNEDLDLGLRLAKKNIPLLRFALVGVNHHTIGYTDPERIWKMIPKHRFRALLARKHVTSRCYLPLFLRMNYSAVLLLISVIALSFSPVSVWGYLSVVVVRSVKRGLLHNYRILPFYIGRDLLFVGSFF